MNQAPNLFDEVHKSTTAVVDTAQISQLFLQRPQNIATYRLGQWFAAAHKNAISFEHKRQLSQCAGSLETKLLIVSLGLNSLPLKPLQDFNQQMLKKGEKL